MSDDTEDAFDLVRFNRSRDHGVVSPPERGAHFTQDGFMFGADGRVAPDWLDEQGKSRLRRKAARAKADRAADQARRKSLVAAGIDPDEPDDGTEPRKPRRAVASDVTEEGDGAPDGAGVNLIAWAKGERKFQWFKIKSAFLEQHAKAVENKEDALVWLVDNDFIDKDEVNI
jgi:hypothetical protein